MVFVKVRETYDLHTTKNKMTVIAVHTPRPDILKRSYPGLLMQCKAYRPYSADVRIACASVLPLDPQGVGTSDGDVAPEDVFNPILYKAMSNFGMSQLEARINYLNYQSQGVSSQVDVNGDTAIVDVDTVTPAVDEFPIYYGLLANTHDWKHANPQAGLSMTGLRPLVYELNYNIGDNTDQFVPGSTFGDPGAPATTGYRDSLPRQAIVGNSKPMPFINTTSYTFDESTKPSDPTTYAGTGFRLPNNTNVNNAELDVPWLNCVVAAIIVPPSRLHEMFYRMVVEWTVEFSQIRPIYEIAEWGGLSVVGNTTHYQNYNYASTKEALTGDPSTMLDSDSCMVSANVDVNKVM